MCYVYSKLFPLSTSGFCAFFCTVQTPCPRISCCPFADKQEGESLPPTAHFVAPYSLQRDFAPQRPIAGKKYFVFFLSFAFANRRLYPKYRGIYSVAPFVMAFA
jgi:hypothetical protein